MSTATVTAPARDLQGYYRQQRAAGRPHDQAVTACCHAFGRRERDLYGALDRAREQWESDRAAAAATVDREPEETAPIDPMDARQAVLQEQLDELHAEKQALALDAIDGDEAARKSLTKVEATIKVVNAELDHLDLARAERARRAADDAREAETTSRADARATADELAGQLPGLLKDIDAAAAAFADTLASYQEVFVAQQQAAAVAAGRDYQGARMLSRPFEQALKHALTCAGVSHLLDLPPGAPRPLA